MAVRVLHWGSKKWGLTITEQDVSETSSTIVAGLDSMSVGLDDRKPKDEGVKHQSQSYGGNLDWNKAEVNHKTGPHEGL